MRAFSNAGKGLFTITTGICIAIINLYPKTSPPDPKTDMLLGKWEVLEYAEQGVPVKKKSPSLPQAIAVWQHNWPERSLMYYGYNPDYDRKAPRHYDRIEEQDSVREVSRVMDVISEPYYAVFFQDSTLAMYNKSADTGRISFSKSRRYHYYPGFSSFDITQGLDFYEKTNVQVIELNDTTMRLFISENGEVVVLKRLPFDLP